MADSQNKRQRRALRWAQRSICAGCGGHLQSVRQLHYNDLSYPTFDHVVLRSLGGAKTLVNGLLKHRRCNQERGCRQATGCDRIWQTLVAERLAVRPTSFKTFFKGGKRNAL